MDTVVVIPARDEEALIGACLESVRIAAPNAPIVVVADSCVDRTAEIARSFASVTVVEVDAAGVGEARRLGVFAALSQVETPLERLWIANTDADSVVPANWISLQERLAESGADAVVGTVRPRASDLSADELARWHRSHDDGQAIGHVHGANLGVRASVYLAAGGFESVLEHEDNDLVHRIRSAGFTISATDQCEVVTSGRRFGRTPGGYAAHLRSTLRHDSSDLEASELVTTNRKE